MRIVYILILLFFVGAVGVFVFQNSQLITLQYLGGSLACPPWLLVGIVYLVGMVSGWTVVGLVQYWFRRVSERPAH